MRFRTVIHTFTFYTDVDDDESLELYGCPIEELDERRVMEKDYRQNVKRLVERSDDGNLTGWSVTDIRGSITRLDQRHSKVQPE